MIVSFADDATEEIFYGRPARHLPGDIQATARRRLRALHQARSIGDLAAIPGHRLERLRGDREGQYSIRINGQWRVCFNWSAGDAYDVEIVDYH